jgi:hypothetical protein
MIGPTGAGCVSSHIQMDQTNRAIIVTAALLFIFVIFVVIMLAWGSPDSTIDRIYRLADYLTEHNNQETKLIITFGGFILALGALLLIIYEMTPPQSGSLRVEVGSGDARISTEEIALRVENEIRAMPQVQDVQATVGGRGSKAEVNLALHVQPQADLAQTAGEACARVRDLIENKMGVGLLSEPKAELHYRELQVVRGPNAAGPVSESPAPAWKPAVQPTEGQQVSHETEATSEGPTAVS